MAPSPSSPAPASPRGAAVRRQCPQPGRHRQWPRVRPRDRVPRPADHRLPGDPGPRQRSTPTDESGPSFRSYIGEIEKGQVMTKVKTDTLDVPGATLGYDIREREVESAEPVLLMIGSPMDASGF